MDEQRRSAGPILAIVAALLAAAGALVLLTRPAAGPAPVAWDREACAYCRMHIGDPRFAAQLQPVTGEPVSFDDPGCLFLFLDERAPQVAAVYFRHETEDRWLRGEEVRFRVDVEQTPMGFGLAATTASANTLPLSAARAWLRERRKGS